MPPARAQRIISVLFCSSRSIYAHLPGCDVWTRKRDAAKFTAPHPVIAHPPCRTWSKFLRTQAKPLDFLAEQNLGRFAVATAQKNGGIVEQPAGSFLWSACQLPRPGDNSDPFCYTIQIEQSWFGMATRKKTWLLICGVPRAMLPAVPFQFDPKPNSQVWQNSHQRSRTPTLLAEWLCQVARSVWWREGER